MHQPELSFVAILDYTVTVCDNCILYLNTSGAEGVVPVDDNPAYITMKRITLNKNTAYETVTMTSHYYETVNKI